MASEKIWIQKNLDPKKFGLQKILILKKILIQEKFGSQNYLGPEKIWVPKNKGWKKILGPEKILIPNLGLKKSCSKNNSLFFILKKFGSWKN